MAEEAGVDFAAIRAADFSAVCSWLISTARKKTGVVFFPGFSYLLAWTDGGQKECFVAKCIDVVGG